MAALWRETFGLEAWFFLADTTSIGVGVRPRVIERDGRRSVLVFTDELAALHVATRAVVSKQDEVKADFATLEVPHDRVIDLCEALAAEGLFSAIFNDGPAQFEAPLTALAALAAAAGDSRSSCDGRIFDACVLGGGPSGGEDVGSLLARAMDGPCEARDRAIKALLRLDSWWFICNPREPESVYVRRFDGVPAVLAFTDERHALDACQQFGVAGDAGELLLLQLAGEDAVEWLNGFRAHAVDRVVFDALTTPLHVEIDTMRDAHAAPD